MASEKLAVDATIEEEIFYPAARPQVPDVDSLLDEAEVEHATAKELIAELDSMEANDALFSATFTVFSEYIKHHVSKKRRVSSFRNSACPGWISISSASHWPHTPTK